MGVTGAGSRLQLGKESVYGTLVTMTDQMNFLSESLKLEVEKKTEDNLLTSVVNQAGEIVGLKSSGDFVLGLKPENAGLILKLGMGAEGTPTLKGGTTGVYQHPFTLISATASMPSFDITVDRKQAVKAYTGCKIDTLKLEAHSQDTLRATVTVKSRTEVTGTAAVLTAPSLKSFKFAGGTLTIDAVSFCSVTDLTLEIMNKLTDEKPNICSGLYSPEPLHETREVKITLEADYDAQTEAIHETNFKAGTLCALVAKFYSTSEIEAGQPYEIDITIPNVEIVEASPNVDGRDKITISISGNAVAVGSVEPLTIDYFSEKATAY
jgi:hypothetical protein